MVLLPRQLLVPGTPGSALVSLVGMGTSPLGHAYGTPDESVAVEAVREAVRLSINFFDTAPFYGSGKAEQIVGEGLKGAPRDQIIVCTKVGKYRPGEAADFSAARITSGLEDSLARLQMSYVDVALIHDVEYADDLQQLFHNADDAHNLQEALPIEAGFSRDGGAHYLLHGLTLGRGPAQIINETLPALAKLRDQKKIRYVGFSGLPLDCFTYILDRAPRGAVDVVLSYCHATLIDSTLTEHADYFKEKGVGVISASVTSMGLFTKQGPQSWHPAPPATLEAAKEARAIAARHGVDIGTLSIKAALRAPGVAVTLIGMASPQEVQTDVNIALQALGLVDDPDAGKEEAALREIQEVLKPHQGVTWPTGNPNNRT